MADAKRGACIRVGVVLGLCAALVACSGKQQEVLNEREYAQYRSRGTAVVEGQVTHTLSNGQTLYGSACQVRLTPITTQSTRYMNEVVMQGGTKPWPSTADAIWWLEQADQQGRFRFSEVPAGSYYLTCPVVWREPGGATRERILWAETTVGPGDRVEVAVSR
ncbi:MAG: hypothetical protein AB1689_02945 [Thermodesulfobacteriota bacterium]